MSGDFLTYVDISDTTKGAYCPRQVYNMSPEFKETPFFTQYCANVPCRGDICKNRAACWEMLASPAPYVQDDLIKVSQQPVCPSEFFGRLSEYAHDCCTAPEKIFKQFQSDFGRTEFCAHTCPMSSIQCLGKTLKGQLFIENTCWPKLLAELKVKQK